MARVFLAIVGAAYLVLAVYAKVLTAGEVRVGDLITKMNDVKSSLGAAGYQSDEES